jgi:2-polyprenyl-3-methyl-5-hydroxy-6-metoxy-1,4-benzoquinol methylase
MIVSLYFFLERLILLIHNGTAALLQGVALGLLNNETLERLTEYRYASQTSLASYAGESYLNSGLLPWEQQATHCYFPPGGRVLVAAAGAGREMLALARDGFEVDGFDCCLSLVESGRVELGKHGIDATLEYAPPSTVPQCRDYYDAVLVGFSGYMYIAGRDRRIRFLRDLCSCLRPNRPLMVSFTEGSPGRRRVWTARIGTVIRKLRGAGPVEEGDCLKDGFQHHFVRHEILSEMTAAGVELVYYPVASGYGHAVGLVRKSQVD